MNNILPHSIDHELSIISSLLINPKSADDIFCRLAPNDFYRTGHRLIFEIMRSLHQKGEPADLPSTVMALQQRGLLEKAGGAAFISGLPDTCPVPSSIDYYCTKLEELSIRRRLIFAGNEIMKAASTSIDGLDRLIEFSQKAVLDAENGHREQKTTRRFNLVHAGSIEVKAPEFLIKPLLEVDTLSLSFGDPGCGKSFFAVDMALSIACAVDLHGLPVKQGPVVYIVGEGQNGIIRRMMAWSIVHGVDYRKHAVYLSLLPAAMCDDNQVGHMMTSIEELADTAGPPVLIVIDTVARNFGPGDENNTADMTRFIAAADKIRSLYHSAVHLVHHTGHGDKTRGRGNTALKGALDAEYKVEKDIENTVLVKATKMKDAGYPEPMAFKIRQVELPITDEDGQPVTSAVLHRIDYQPPTVPAGNAGKGANQQLGLSVLTQLYEDHRRNVETSGRCHDSARVLFDDWRSCCMDRGMTRSAFWKAKESLLKIGEIKIDGSYVFLN